MNLLQRSSGNETLPVMISTRIEQGESLYHRQAGGGGFGSPLERDPQLVSDDVRNEKVSRAAANGEYGVVFQGRSLKVDAEATEELRRRLATQQSAAPTNTP